MQKSQSLPFLHRPKGEISSTCRIKTFPDGSREFLACDKAVFVPGDWEPEKKKPRKKSPINGTEKKSDCADDEARTERAWRRAKAQMRDLARSNDFTYFVTLTLDRSKIDRYDMAEITRRLTYWLDNNVRRYGLTYILAPERHKDGAIHFHGFFNDALPAYDSGVKDSKGHTVYNLPKWRFGFSTAIELYGEYDAAVSYVCKYVGKQADKIGGRWYYSGGALRRPEIDYADISIWDLMEIPGSYRFDIPEAGLSFCQVRLGPGE